jgi:hypothetical protein
MVVNIFNWCIELHFRARKPWTHFKIWGLQYNTRGRHIVWGRMSLHFENVVEKCYPVCRECSSPDIGEKSAGDESFTVCDSCQTVEGGYAYISRAEYEGN